MGKQTHTILNYLDKHSAWSDVFFCLLLLWLILCVVRRKVSLQRRRRRRRRWKTKTTKEKIKTISTKGNQNEISGCRREVCFEHQVFRKRNRERIWLKVTLEQHEKGKHISHISRQRRICLPSKSNIGLIFESENTSKFGAGYLHSKKWGSMKSVFR